MSAGGGAQGWETLLTPYQAMVLCPKGVNNTFWMKSDNRQSHLHAPPTGGAAQSHANSRLT
jgi:hypothetical protein